LTLRKRNENREKQRISLDFSGINGFRTEILPAKTDGASGRDSDYLKEIAFDYAFLQRELGTV
jgi:hypothetical protein